MPLKREINKANKAIQLLSEMFNIDFDSNVSNKHLCLTQMKTVCLNSIY